MPPTTRAGKKAGKKAEKKKKAPAPAEPSEDTLSVFDLECSPKPPSDTGVEGAILHGNLVPELTEDGTNRMRMEQVLHEIQITQRVKPTRLDGPSLDVLLSPKPVREIYSGAVHEEGRWTFYLAPEPFTTEGKKAQSVVKDVTENGGLSFKPFSKSRSSQVLKPRWLSDSNSRQLVLAAMCRYLSRLPLDLKRLSRAFVYAIFLKCVADEVPEQYRKGAIEFEKYSAYQQGKGFLYFQLALPISATSDGQFKSPIVRVPKLNVPDICTNLFVDDMFAFTFSEDTLKVSTAAQRQLLMFIQSQCTKYVYGTVATDEAVSVLANAIKWQYGVKRGAEIRGPYRGLNIVATGRGVVQRKRDAAAGDFYPSDVVEETTKNLPTIRFGSLQKTKEQRQLDHRQAHFRVAEAAHIRFVETGSIEEAWMAGCDMADDILESGDTILYPPCGESEENRERTLHCCRDCWFVWPCSKLQRIDDRLVCPLCRNASDAVMTGEAYERTTFPSERELEAAYAGTTVDDAERKKAAKLARRRYDERKKDTQADKVRTAPGQIKPDKWQHSAHTAAQQFVRKEVEALKIPIEKKNEHRREFEARYPLRVGYNETWVDEYSTERLQPSMDIVPLKPSPDAVLPIFLSDDGKLRVHTYPNMRMTTDYLNRMKSTFPAIILKIIWLLNTTAREEGEDRDNLLRRLDHLYLIRLQVPFRKKAKRRFQMSRADFDAFVQQCQTGIATAQGCSKISGRWKISDMTRTASSTETPRIESMPQLGEVKKLLEAVESKTGQCLDRINGVPYPFKGGPKPAEWSWETLYLFFQARLKILRNFCNALWQTTATVPALIVVCCWQYLERKSTNSQWPECREWLNLPLSIYSRHPLAISIGKADHSAEMSTGFENNEALTIDTFDMAKCNILMETWTSNRTKKNYDADVDRIRDHFTNTLRPEALPHWPLELPSLPPDSTIPQLERRQLLIGDDDEWDEDSDDDDDQSQADSAADSAADYVDDVVGNFAGDSEFQPNTDGRELPPQRTAAQTIPARTAIDGQRPQYRNLTNLQGTCYFSTVVQLLYGIPHVRSFVNSPVNFRFIQKEECRRLVAALRGIFWKLDEGGKKLPAADTSNLLREADSFGNDYGKEAHDSMELFQQFLDMLIETSSATSAGGESARPLEQMTAQLEKTQNPLKDDAEKIWAGFTRNGRETLLAETLYHQVARERVCTSCGFTDRLFQQLATVIIESPDGILAPAEKRYDLKELFRDYVLDTAAEAVTDRVSHCPVTTCKSVLGPQTRRIVKTPQILSFTFRRVLQDFSGQEQKWLNHVEVPERLDLAEYADDVSLPSERKQSEPGSTPMRWVTDEMTDYVLQATIHYRPTGAHYVAYVRHDDKWIRFDDIEETPDECSPWDGIQETPDEAVYVAVYLKSQPPPPLQAPAQTGEKHPRPGTSGSTAAERNQRQGFPPLPRAH